MEYLAHYGVKGMKWGVRNAETNRKYSGASRGLTDKQKKYLKYGAIGAGAALAIVGGIALYKTGIIGYGPGVYKDQIVKVGSKMQSMRFGSDSTEFIKETLYATNHPMDKALYRGPFTGGKQIASLMQGRDGSAYRAVLSSSKNIKVAGKDSGEKALKQLLDKGKFTAPELKALGFSYYQTSDGKTTLIGDVSKNIPDAYRRINRSPKLSGLSPSTQNKLFTQLKSEGYSAVLDLNNVNPGYGAKRAMIIFDTEGIALNSIKRQHGATTLANTYIHHAYKHPAYATGMAAVSGAGIKLKVDEAKYRK